jgi:hypothetical protein
MEISIDIIQQSQIDSNTFSKGQLIQLLGQTTQEEFNRFCKEIALLHEFYVFSKGLNVTDRPVTGDEFYKLEPIDWERPITFKRVK